MVGGGVGRSAGELIRAASVLGETKDQLDGRNGSPAAIARYVLGARQSETSFHDDWKKIISYPQFGVFVGTFEAWVFVRGDFSDRLDVTSDLSIEFVDVSHNPYRCAPTCASLRRCNGGPRIPPHHILGIFGETSE